MAMNDESQAQPITEVGIIDKIKAIWNESSFTQKVKATRRRIPQGDRAMSRPSGWLLQRVNESLREKDVEPVQFQHDVLGNVVFPDTWYGLLAYLARWDSLLSDEEKVAVDEIYAALWPMGELVQVQFEDREQPDHWAERNGLGG